MRKPCSGILLSLRWKLWIFTSPGRFSFVTNGIIIDCPLLNPQLLLESSNAWITFTYLSNFFLNSLNYIFRLWMSRSSRTTCPLKFFSDNPTRPFLEGLNKCKLNFSQTSTYRHSYEMTGWLQATLCKGRQPMQFCAAARDVPKK